MFWRPITESNERGFVADYVTIYHVNTANPKQAPKTVKPLDSNMFYKAAS